MEENSTTGWAAIFKSKEEPLYMAKHPLSEPIKGEVLVQVEMTSLCTSDLHTISGRRQEPSPLILGHESIGKVYKLPEDSVYDMEGQKLKIDDRISWSIFSAPAESDWCRRGMRQKSPEVIKYGHCQLSEQHYFSGGLASHCHLRADTCIMKIANDTSLASFCPVNCSLATVVGGFRLAGDISGKNLLIFGGGMLGVYACAYAHAEGAGKVVIVEPDKRRRLITKKFGALEALSPKQLIAEKDHSFDITIDTSGQLGAMQQGLHALATGGIAIWLGAVFPQPLLPLDTEMVVKKLITIKGLHNYNEEDFRKAVNFMKDYSHHFPFASLIEKIFPLHEINEAIDFAKKNKPFRVAIVPKND